MPPSNAPAHGGIVPPTRSTVRPSNDPIPAPDSITLAESSTTLAGYDVVFSKSSTVFAKSSIHKNPEHTGFQLFEHIHAYPNEKLGIILHGH